MRFWVTWSLRNNGRLSFSRLTFDLCLQRQVRHPFVHDLQDCWQTQRHVYISESDRDRWPNPTQIHSPFTSPHLFSPQNWQLGPRSTHSPTQTQLLQHDEQKKKKGKEVPVETLKIRVFWACTPRLIAPLSNTLQPCNPSLPLPLHRVASSTSFLFPPEHLPSFSKLATDSESVTHFVCLSTPCKKRTS